jgi:toxin-antitoxin system PIN domain toxin
MILVDANLLVYAHVRSLPQHDIAKSWLDDQLSGYVRVGLPWPSLLAFLRLVSNPRVFQNPESVNDAWTCVEEWLELDSVWIPVPTERHPSILASLVPHIGTGANLVPDAHLAALAMEHGLELCSTDGDFARFPALRWRNPLLDSSQ